MTDQYAAERNVNGGAMKYHRIDGTHMDLLWELQKAYKAEIGEAAPGARECARLTAAVQEGQITFYGAWDQDALIGCCSITVGFSTFDYAKSGVFEDFYICPAYRHTGIARQLVRYAVQESGVSSLTVGCADCDLRMYQALGFTISLGNLLAYQP